MERGIFGVAACGDTCVDVGLGAFLSSVGGRPGEGRSNAMLVES
jgi:hypothetical protein